LCLLIFIGQSWDHYPASRAMIPVRKSNPGLGQFALTLDIAFSLTLIHIRWHDLNVGIKLLVMMLMSYGVKSRII